ncbi:neuroguidin isoform X3 [Osmia bicornis bicornis]|uniref:neuroguidin isoform X3 n=1 Tax=Osmia bicornis bicornis TaxID=1437191 RepID=UPI0010F4E829|nr:neuroguidin isoform X3 [Osmia bicornis bicornis]XP_034176307.1 neuroguidin isoform X2 [Osmia lignaria]
MVQAIDEMEQRDLPQAFRLLGEMNANVLQVNQLVDNMLIRVKNGEISTDKGLSFLEMKYHMLLSYLINLTYVVLRKCSGERIEGDPSIDRLIEIRTVLEKIRPIDHKLKYQIDKLVKTAVTGTINSDDPTNFKANPDAFDTNDEESDSDQGDADEGFKSTQSRKSNVYVPPKLAAVHYDGDETVADKIRKAGERVRRRAVSGAVLRELKEEYLDAPIEDTHGLGEKQTSLGRENKRKIEYEENYMTRLPVTKQEKHRRRQMTTVGTLGEEITSFGESSFVSAKKRKTQKKGKAKKSFKKKRHH